jgi:fluoride ion exporter CrcB/FEX
MTLLDLITIAYSLFAIGFGLVLVRRSQSMSRTLPPFFGIGGGMSIFTSFMASSILLKSTSGWLDYTLNNLLISVVFGVIVYYSGRMLIQRMSKNQRWK